MYYLGVDGGGTKTAFMLIDEKGKVIVEINKPSCHYIQVGFNGYKNIIKEGITDICNKAGIKIKDIDYSFLGIPCYGEFKEDVKKLELIIAEIIENNNFKCANDVEAGWAGSLACQAGINIVAGTGAIGFGRDNKGNTARASGWGYFCGDEGSAYWLGKELISLFTKQADGRIEKTPLYDIVYQELSLKEDFDLITIVYDKLGKKRDKIAKLAMILEQAAKQGDKKVLEIFERAAYEHSLTVKAIIKKLSFSNKDKILVSYSGGVFNAGKYILDPFQSYINQFNVKLIKPILKPVAGAALCAVKLDGKIKDTSLIIEEIKQDLCSGGVFTPSEP